MKGRRRARRVALQALYELDQSHHLLDTVLVGRVRDFLTTAIEGGLAPPEQPSAYRLLEHLDPQGLSLPLLANLAPLLDGANTDDAAPSAPSHDLQPSYQFLSDLVDQLRYADALVRGVWAARSVLDKTVAEIAPEWPVEQMAPVDRNVLRMALWEIAAGSAPPKVAISEAVELARLFAGEASRRMVNGALGSFVGHGAHLHLPKEAIAPFPHVAALATWQGNGDADEAEEAEAADVVEVAEEGEEAAERAAGEMAVGERAAGEAPESRADAENAET